MSVIIESKIGIAVQRGLMEVVRTVSVRPSTARVGSGRESDGWVRRETANERINVKV